MLSVAYLTLMERKLLGHIQIRFGPNRCGPYGILQPFSDAIKAFFKEDLIPGRADKGLFVIAPMITIVSAIGIFAVIPFGDQFTLPGTDWVVKLRIADVDIGLLYIFGLASLGEYGIILGGGSSGNKFGLTGSLRAAAQMISYEVALGLSVIGVILLSQSPAPHGDRQPSGRRVLELEHLVSTGCLFPLPHLRGCGAQPDPLRYARGGIGAGLRIQHRIQQHEIRPLLHGRIRPHGHCGRSRRHPLFRRMAAHYPGPGHDSRESSGSAIKVFILLFFFMWERGTFPRLRYDQVMKLGWKVMFPLALINLLITGLVISLKG